MLLTAYSWACHQTALWLWQCSCVGKVRHPPLQIYAPQKEPGRKEYFGCGAK